MSLKLESSPSLAPCSYVLLVSGTMNPPHRGHVSIGIHAARRLRRLGHSVTAVCYVPVHDNYLHNKITATAMQNAAASTAQATPEAETSADTLCFSLSERCALLRMLLDSEAAEDAPICHVLDYELVHGSELLKSSPNYWAPKLPNGYLRTVPTAELIHHFVNHSPFMVSGSKLALVFGIDTVAGMASWNAPERFLSRADLVIVSRAIDRVEFCKDPAELLRVLRHFHIEAKVPFAHSGKTVFGAELGSFVNTNAKGKSSLIVLPPLPGADEGLSSTSMRMSIASCLKVTGELLLISVHSNMSTRSFHRY